MAPQATTSRLGLNASTAAFTGPSPASSSHDLVTDVEEAERQTNRRSMYRSPGTSSSPDLATLLRKAKERGGALGVQSKKDSKRRDDREPPPPLPGQPTSSHSYSSATLVASPSSFSSRHEEGNPAEWVLTSPHRYKDNGTVKAPKSSVRAKTSAFWGKMMGQSTVRERSTDASLHPLQQTSLMNAFTPPVPTIPPEHRSPGTSPIADVFSTTIPRTPESRRPLPSRKPLPPIASMRMGSEDVEKPYADKPSPLPPIPSPSPPTSKRRSMSVSDKDMKLVMSPRTEPENTLLDVFKGELSTLDSGASLDLQNKPSAVEDDLFSPSAIIPPRSSSLQLSAKSPTGSATAASAHATSSRLSPSITPSRSRSGPPTAFPAQSPRDGNSSRLKVLHRPTASNSEPSLVSAIDDARESANGPAPGARTTVSSPRPVSFQHIASPDTSRFTSSPTPIITGEDTEDMETRGKEMATRCWNEDETFLGKEKIAEWLGGHGLINKVALKHYVEFFDFASLRLDIAFRRLCGKLYLKGETQQVDRILEQFSRRYWDCNPGGLYGSANIVHAVSYSLLLLNTDLHVAELTSRMSRTQFVRNTMTAIQMQLQPNSAARLSSSDLTYDDCGSSVRGAGSDETEMMTRSKRSDSITSWNSVSRDAIATLPVSPAQSNQISSHQSNGSTPSVQISNGHDPVSPSRQHPVQHGRAWESDMEVLLKEMYNAIKHQQILQPTNSGMTRSSVSSLSPGGSGMMRNRSLRSQPDRLATLKRGSIRGLQSILSAQSGISPYSSNSSIDGRVSPSPSFATSTHEAMYGSSSSFLNPTLGFASNLSHTIIREAQEDDDRSVHSEDSTSTTISISDEELALLGAPWAKEGMLCRKQYWESAGKRAKDKTWLDVFVVIQKGELSMFTFGDHTSGASGAFGGGNWLANAHAVGTIHLAHSLAHALPPPGYNKRPHCMVLTLANRGVYFFQAGTEELVNEWVSTCNYWAARTSKEPLAGGVSNMEYGWNRVADVYGHGRSLSQTEFQREPDIPDTVSVRSGKSTRSKYGWKDGAATIRGPYSPRTDKTYINEWKAPLPPTVSSVHDEEAQLDALRKHVASLKKDLEVHNELREPMAGLYPSRSANALKAQSNWEEKSQYLLREIVKYDLYIDALQAAMSLRLKKRGEKALEHALSASNPVDEPSTSGSQKWKSSEAPIDEEPEPTTPGPRQQTHRRETAEVDDD
ncbi:hypothetical protein GALMADRAFT_515159 [Galerina marginata CBS 339.88]|uniref:SEC7 domain-containing protein n=1 Tax=Galerina marginata (strain CBS 339.88) TaxID=685588 RepID=A0A067T7R6_GALM3|nr:hypothetical protein GALMADRAFT_515159 [Galerina marginata CBS 339.88]